MIALDLNATAGTFDLGQPAIFRVQLRERTGAVHLMARFEFAAVGFSGWQFRRTIELRLGFFGGFGFEFCPVAAPAEEEEGCGGGNNAEDDCGNDDTGCGADGEF